MNTLEAPNRHWTCCTQEPSFDTNKIKSPQLRLRWHSAKQKYHIVERAPDQ